MSSNIFLAITWPIAGGCRVPAVSGASRPACVNGRDGGGAPPSVCGADAHRRRRARRRRLQQCGLGLIGGRRRSSRASPTVGRARRHAARAGRRNEAIITYNSALARDRFAGRHCVACQGVSRDRPPRTGAAPVNQALALRPNDPKLLVLIGVADDFIGQHQQAQALLPAGSAAGARRPALMVDLALSLALSGNYTKRSTFAASRDGAFGYRAGTADAWR